MVIVNTIYRYSFLLHKKAGEIGEIVGEDGENKYENTDKSGNEAPKAPFAQNKNLHRNKIKRKKKAHHR